MSWHGFLKGHTYSLSKVVAVCELHIQSGEVEKVEEKMGERYLKTIRNCGYEKIVFMPTGRSIGASPMSANAWRTPDGQPIWKRRIVPRRRK